MTTSSSIELTYFRSSRDVRRIKTEKEGVDMRSGISQGRRVYISLICMFFGYILSMIVSISILTIKNYLSPKISTKQTLSNPVRFVSDTQGLENTFCAQFRVLKFDFGSFMSFSHHAKSQIVLSLRFFDNMMARLRHSTS